MTIVASIEKYLIYGKNFKKTPFRENFVKLNPVLGERNCERPLVFLIQYERNFVPTEGSTTFTHSLFFFFETNGNKHPNSHTCSSFISIKK